jgi:hypothetical protein
MKQTKSIVITAIFTLLALGTVVYTSCRKDRCKTLVCQNGGTCRDGFCLCPTGYTGSYCQTANVSSVSLRNETFTRVTILLNGYEYSVDSGAIITFTGSYGDTLRATAKTKGTYGVNVTLAPIKVGFPIRGIEFSDLDVSPEYFFLMATNNNNTLPFISQVHVNYGQRDSTLDITTVNNDGKNYHIGYYKAHSDTKVLLEKTPLKWPFNNLNLPMTKNQFYNAVID